MADPTTLFFYFVENYNIIYLYNGSKSKNNKISKINNDIMIKTFIEFLKLTINAKYKCDNKIKVIFFRQSVHKILNSLRDISNNLENNNVIIPINKGEKVIIKQSERPIIFWLRDNIIQMCTSYGF
jgi:hypothetical protein